MTDPARYDGSRPEPAYATLLPPMRESEIDALLAAERERCMKIIDDLRISEAGNFKDPKCQGQRGQDRSDALYDAYQAVKNGDLT